MSSLMETLGKAIELTRTLMKAKDAIQNAEAKMAVADLSIELAELKMQIATLLDDNHELQQKIKQLSGGQTVTIKDGLYYTDTGDGPFCTTCFDSQSKLIRVIPMSDVFSHVGRWRCGICKSHFK